MRISVCHGSNVEMVQIINVYFTPNPTAFSSRNHSFVVNIANNEQHALN